LRLSHQAIAEAIGSTRVTITRLLGDLKDSGLLNIERKKITVFDPIALAKRFNWFIINYDVGSASNSVAWILIIFLILLGGLIAPFGDLLGTKIGKARFSILKLRPKRTATIVTIITGGFISSVSIGLLILVSEEFRQRLFVDIPFLQKTLDESKKALVPLQEERKKLEDKIKNKEKELDKLKSDVKEFRSGNVVIKRDQTLKKIVDFLVFEWKFINYIYERKIPLNI